MSNQSVKLFITQQPGDLLLYKNLSIIAKNLYKDTITILFKLDNLYYKQYDFTPYRKYFDYIIELPPLSYRKNIITSLKEIFRFRKTWKNKVVPILKQYRHITAFLGHSAWFSNNVILYALNRHKNVERIYRFVFTVQNYTQTKISWLRTIWCRMHSLFISSYRVHAIATLQGTFIDFLYAEQIPGMPTYIIGSAENDDDKKKEGLIIPCPWIRRSVKEDYLGSSEDAIVLVLGASIMLDYPEYYVTIDDAKMKLRSFFSALERYYQGCTLYYKPHPADQGSIMPGVNPGKYRILDVSINAQDIIETYGDRIRAVYTVISSAAIWSTWAGIPSYTIYRYLCKPDTAARFDGVFKAVTPRFFTHLSHLNEIGCIDHQKSTMPYLDLMHLDAMYRALLK